MDRVVDERGCRLESSIKFTAKRPWNCEYLFGEGLEGDAIANTKPGHTSVEGA